MKILQDGRSQRGNDEQNRIGACGPRLENLIPVDDEVLPQNRQGCGASDRDQVIQAAVEESRLRQHRDGRRACLVIAARDL